jgi:hypothetical protein
MTNSIDARNKLTDAIRNAKQSHWENSLEEMGDGSLWTSAKYIDSPVAGEGGASRCGQDSTFSVHRATD